MPTVIPEAPMPDPTRTPEDPLADVERERRREDEADREYTTPERQRELESEAEPGHPPREPRPGER
jgi:hypothetical protein